MCLQQKAAEYGKKALQQACTPSTAKLTPPHLRLL
jgi:hypothetical protein